MEQMWIYNSNGKNTKNIGLIHETFLENSLSAIQMNRITICIHIQMNRINE